MESDNGQGPARTTRLALRSVLETYDDSTMMMMMMMATANGVMIGDALPVYILRSKHGQKDRVRHEHSGVL